MKQPKTFLFLSIVVAILVLGIAYAAITQVNLTVSGDVVADGSQENFKVRFAGNGEKVSGNGSGTFTLVANDETQLTATLDVYGLTTKDQTATWKIDIENISEGELAAALSLNQLTPKVMTLNPEVADGTDTTGTASDYFAVSATLDKDTIDFKDNAGTTDVVENKATLTITVTMLKTPVDEIKGTFTVKVYADPVNG